MAMWTGFVLLVGYEPVEEGGCSGEYDNESSAREFVD